MDFTIEIYNKLLNTLRNQGFSFLTFEEFLSNYTSKAIVLRHDVDRLAENSLIFAKLQADVRIKGSYYFRIVPESFDEKIINEIYELGHEVGYHYEDLGTTAQRHKGVTAEEELVELAIKSFKENLEKLRQLVPVKTICMHGSPMSRWDSRLLWKYYDYRDFGIAGEPYFDINFDEVLYLTDTGRRWDGDSFNIRDRSIDKRDLETKRLRENEGVSLSVSHPLSPLVPQSLSPSVNSSLQPSAFRHPPFPRFHSTCDIICAAEEGQLPDRIMMTFHPQRWTDKPISWVNELMWQNLKNVGKYFLVKNRK